MNDTTLCSSVRRVFSSRALSFFIHEGPFIPLQDKSFPSLGSTPHSVTSIVLFLLDDESEKGKEFQQNSQAYSISAARLSFVSLFLIERR